MASFFGFGSAAPAKGGVKYESLDSGPGEAQTHVVGKNGTPLARRGGEAAAAGGTSEGRLRQIEQRAAAAQQRSLGKKISALNEEMAAVEAMLNASAASNQMDPAVASEWKDSLNDTLSSVETQHQVKSKDLAIEIEVRAHTAPAADAEAARPWRHVVSADTAEAPSPTARRGQPKQSRRRLHGEDDNDKYGGKASKGWDALLVYFGQGGKGLPLPVSIQRAGKLPFSFERVVTAIVLASSFAALIIYILSAEGKLPVQ
ncbi:hypothetical protein T484DRAFT_1953749, partial [Baffinella frigidus]